ncbi:MAG: hypothetical protein R3C97_16875 [Geminicoccaceae bacterium]
MLGPAAAYPWWRTRRPTGSSALAWIVSSYTDEYSQRMVASTLNLSDVVPVISSTGSIKTILLAALAVAAKQYGARSIAITKSHSPLAAEVDVLVGYHHSPRAS